MSNPLDPEMMSPAERLAEAASLLARSILRSRLRTADGREPALSGRSYSCEGVPSRPQRVSASEGVPPSDPLIDLGPSRRTERPKSPVGV